MSSNQLPEGFEIVSQPNSPELPDGFEIVQPMSAQPTRPNYVSDALSSFGSGLARGAAETAMLPETIHRLGSAAGDYLGGKADEVIRAIVGAPQRTAEDDAKIKAARDGGVSGIIDNSLNSAQDAARGTMDQYLYAPQTTPGKYAETVGEFVAPGGAMSRTARTGPLAARIVEGAGNAVRNALAPGIASEAAGQVTEGTPIEPVARFAGALAGNVGPAALRAANAPDAVLRRAVGDPNNVDWQRALQLQNNQFGVQLTGPEAISQAAGGGTALPNLQRVVEGSTEGRAASAPFFAARPGQVQTAVGNVLDTIAPQSATPSALGPQASQAATDAVRAVEQARTAAVNPLYRAADADRVPEPFMRGILGQIDQAVADDATGILHGPLNNLRQTLVQTPATANAAEVPITDIGNLDRARKDFRDRIGMLQTGQDAITKERAASINNILQQLDGQMETSSPNFAAAKQQYADITRNQVEPVVSGPTGRVAAATDTPGAYNAILPQNPMVGSGNEIVDAIQRISQENPDVVGPLVRQALGDRFNKALTETQGGVTDNVGAKFHKDVAGNPAREEALNAALQGTPAAVTMPQLLDVLQATSRRQTIGSNTEFNRALNAELSAGSPIGRAWDAARTGGVGWITKTVDAANRARLRGSLTDLSNMFTDPRSVELIQAAAGRTAPRTLADAIARTALQSGVVTSDRGR